MEEMLELSVDKLEGKVKSILNFIPELRIYILTKREEKI